MYILLPFALTCSLELGVHIGQQIKHQILSHCNSKIALSFNKKDGCNFIFESSLAKVLFNFAKL